MPTPDWRRRVASLLRWWRWIWWIEPVFAAPLTPPQPDAPTRFVPPLTDRARHPSPAWRPLSSPCVLVVDDNPVNLELASGVLWGLGAGPVLAADGAEAVALALELRPDLILMDLQMPVLDGVEATRQIRRLEQQHGGARMPVVAFTSSTVVDAQLLMRCGFDAVLQKPCEEPAMRECLERWCPPQGRVIDPAAAAHA